MTTKEHWKVIRERSESIQKILHKDFQGVNSASINDLLHAIAKYAVAWSAMARHECSGDESHDTKRS
jgi:hypothetical protein